MMKGFRGAAREARFVCAACIADDGKVVRMIEEHCDGRIAEKPAGLYGFGYDPVFLIPAYDRTFGELGLRVKDRMSHRSKALRKARVFLKGYL
jgi:XTP/dITP diphosphohydrolase